MEFSELQNTNIKIKNSMDGLHSRMKWAEERISKLEDRITEMTQYEQQRENRLKTPILTSFSLLKKQELISYKSVQ